MGNTQAIYQEANRRLHRLLGVYLALWGWKHRVDCIVVSGDELMSFLDLEVVQSKRISQLAYDLAEFFPEVRPLPSTSAGLKGMLFSRNLNHARWSSRLEVDEVVAFLNQAGCTASKAVLPSEQEMLSMLSLLIHGVGNFDQPESL